MKTSSAILVLGLAFGMVFAQEEMTYLSILSSECEEPALPAPIFNGVTDAGILAHNDFHAPGEVGSVYHTYSIVEGVLSNDGELCISGTVAANYGTNEEYGFDYCCSTVSGMFPGGMTATGCSGSYGAVTITGKADANGNEFVFYEKNGEYWGEGWMTFPVAFDDDDTVEGKGDFVIKVGCPPDTPEPFCGDGNVDDGETCDYADPNAPEGCRGEAGVVDEFDCTYCGDGNVDDPLEACDDPNPALCDANCQIPQAPGCPNDFNGVECGDWDLTNGHADGGVYARNSFWNDWDARPFTSGVFSYCAGADVEGFVIAISGTFDNKGEECSIVYSCDTVESASSLETTGTDCSGIMQCPSDTGAVLAIDGKSNGSSEVSCYSKYEGDPWTCIGWIEWSTGPSEDEFAVGDLVWTGTCPDDQQLP